MALEPVGFQAMRNFALCTGKAILRMVNIRRHLEFWPLRASPSRTAMDYKRCPKYFGNPSLSWQLGGAAWV